MGADTEGQRRSSRLLRKALVAVLVVLFTTVVSSQPETPLSFRVVNLPPIQPVTGNELLASQELLTLLLVHSFGVLPPGLPAPLADQCLVTCVGEIYEVAEAALCRGATDCNLKAHTPAFASHGPEYLAEYHATTATPAVPLVPLTARKQVSA